VHGYELLGEYERQEVADWASVSKAQVYYAIKKLSKLGLIESKKDRADRASRERTVFGPTARGRKELSASLTKLTWARTRVAQPFTTWLGLSIHLSKAAAGRVLNARRVFLERELARERASLQYIKSLSSARAKAGEEIVGLVIRQMEVELEWVENLLKSH
jgi:DNA-binding PadR family transcriptional regulator